MKRQFIDADHSSALDRHKNASAYLYLCQFNLDLYETLNLSFWGPNWLIPLILAIPSGLSAPLEPSGTPLDPLYPYISAKSTQIFMKLEP